MKTTATLGLVLALTLSAAPAAARTLHWSSLEVAARLDADGKLHVTERQDMVFDGSWNGGERTFRVASGQSLELQRISRLDAETGELIELSRGDLDYVDNYDWTSRHVLRWRSRRPSDPPFDNTTLVYVLEYTLSGILEESGYTYRLDHDFAFPDRYGDIERFVLDLEVDEAWEGELGEHFEMSGIPPGVGFVVTGELTYAGAGQPAAVLRKLPRSLILAAFAMTAAAMVWIFQRFHTDERRMGRYLPADVPQEIGATWLEEHLLRFKAEEAGAIWDQKIGTPEVSAVIARLISEGKLRSSVREGKGFFKSKVLELELLVDLDELTGYDKKLMRKLFFDGRTTTDTQAVREHYKSRGFSPVSEISPSLGSAVKDLTGPGRKAPSKRPTALMLLAAALLFALELVFQGTSILQLVGLVFMAVVVCLLLGYPFAFKYRKATSHLGAVSAGFVLPALGLLGACLLTVAFASVPGVFGLASMALLPVAFFNSLTNVARTRDSIETVKIRQRLAGVRDYFRSELRKELPALDDLWFPYLLAFGLQREVDRWFSAFGTSTDTQRTRSWTSTSSSSGPSWTGGGGAFGGAGATGAWSAAAAGLASGVSAPSSSSGGGGGGGGGSSGGGGGGGW